MYKKISLLIILLNLITQSFAVTPIDLSQVPYSMRNEFELHELSRAIDFNQTTHIRFKQTYSGYPVWGADVIMHISKKSQYRAVNSIEGKAYRGLAMDLQYSPGYLFTDFQANKALQQAINLFEKNTGMKELIQQKKIKLMIYVDHENKAHWAYLIHFFIQSRNKVMRPAYILDALNFSVYESWDDLKTLTPAWASGFGGNSKIGKQVYDGLAQHFPRLPILRDRQKKLCYLKNAAVTVKDAMLQDTVVRFNCSSSLADFNNTFWDGENDAVNGAYSPSNDALFAGNIVQKLYQDWYGVSVLQKEGKPMHLTMRVHQAMDNAYWDGDAMTFGDGGELYYPFVSLGIAAHEISHGFTEQQSNLAYYGQSGGLNESFSDMAAMAAEFYLHGKVNWEIGGEVIKQNNKVMRYMDEPTRDCAANGSFSLCSIDHLQNYHARMDPHQTSGIFNKAFYLLATSDGWDIKKAFNVMVQANRNYWRPLSTFNDAACGVLKAAQDYQYDAAAVKNAFSSVGINLDNTC